MIATLAAVAVHNSARSYNIHNADTARRTHHVTCAGLEKGKTQGLQSVPWPDPSEPNLSLRVQPKTKTRPAQVLRSKQLSRSAFLYLDGGAEIIL